MHRCTPSWSTQRAPWSSRNDGDIFQGTNWSVGGAFFSFRSLNPRLPWQEVNQCHSLENPSQKLLFKALILLNSQALDFLLLKLYTDWVRCKWISCLGITKVFWIWNSYLCITQLDLDGPLVVKVVSSWCRWLNNRKSPRDFLFVNHSYIFSGEIYALTFCDCFLPLCCVLPKTKQDPIK